LRNDSGHAEEDPAIDRPIRVIVADDDPFARTMIKDALQRAEFVVIAEAHNGRQAVEFVLHYRPVVVLMDLVMTDLVGMSATRRILKEIPDQVVVMLTTGGDDEMGMVSLRAGAAGFLTKDLDVNVLPRTLYGALQGEAAISRQFAMRLIEQLRRLPDSNAGLRPVRSPLTPREWEVIDLLAGGLTTDAIAEALVLSSETVRSHVKNILRKLDARSREEAVAVAQRMRSQPPPA